MRGEGCRVLRRVSPTGAGIDRESERRRSDVEGLPRRRGDRSISPFVTSAYGEASPQARGVDPKPNHQAQISSRLPRRRGDRSRSHCASQRATRASPHTGGEKPVQLALSLQPFRPRICGDLSWLCEPADGILAFAPHGWGYNRSRVQTWVAGGDSPRTGGVGYQFSTATHRPG